MRLRKAFRKIHRWVGLMASLWLIQLLMTGLLLQHADDFELTRNFVESPQMLQWFGYGTRAQIWESQGAKLYQIDDVVGFKDRQLNLNGKVIGATLLPDASGIEHWYLITTDALFQLNSLGEVVLQLDDFDGLPTPLKAISNDQADLFIQSNEAWFIRDDSGAFISTQLIPKNINKSRVMTAAEKDQYFANALAGKLSYDKVLHDIHSGIKGSKWLNTISALALLYLCLSGIYLFFKQPKRKRS